MKKGSLYSNIFFSFILQFAFLIFPLVTAPYISEILGAQGLGKVNFATSVVNWFIVFAEFGTITYGIREVSKIRNDREKLSRFFSEIISIKIITSAIVLTVYILCIVSVDRFSMEFWLFLLNGGTILLNIFSMDWFFQGIENYKYITIRSILIKTFSIMLIFLLIKEENDYIGYAAITVFALSFSNIFNFFYLKKFVELDFKGMELKKHIKPLLIFFITSLITSMYTLFDQVILGFIRNDVEVAMFSRAKMFFNLGMSVSISTINALTPRVMNYFTNNDLEYKKLLQKSFDILLMITIPIMFGTFVLSDYLMILLGGIQFEPASNALIVITPLLVITPLSIWNNQQRIITRNQEKFTLKLSGILAVISIILNIVLVTRFGFIGTSLSWLIVELIGFIIAFKYSKMLDGYRMFNISHLKYLLTGLLMFAGVYKVKSTMTISWATTLFSIIVGVLIYVIGLIILNDKYLKEILRKIIQLIK